jgi:hypothetical protein
MRLFAADDDATIGESPLFGDRVRVRVSGCSEQLRDYVLSAGVGFVQMGTLALRSRPDACDIDGI